MSRLLRQPDPRWYAALSSLLLSLTATMTGLLPNNDAYTYLRTAEIFLDQGLAAAYAHYPWAAYSVLIGIVQYLPGIDLFAAAQLLNAAFYVLLTWSFISLVREIDASQRVTLLAAIIILAYPHLNEFRYHLIRDVAFLAFVLLGLLFLLRYYRQAAPERALGFVSATLAAALFRPEALLFLLFAPFLLLANAERSWRQRGRQLLLIQGSTLLLAGALWLFLLISGNNLFVRLSEFVAVYLPFLEHSLVLDDTQRAALSGILFTDHAAQFSAESLGLFVFAGLIAILLAKIVESLGLLVLGLLLYGSWQGLVRVPKPVGRVLTTYLLIAFLVMLAFTLLTRFMTTRYTFVFCTLLLVFVPLIVDRAWARAEEKGKLRSFAWVMGLILLYSVFDAHFSFGEPKTHTTEALRWIEEETDPALPLLSNEEYIAWKSGRIADYDQVQRGMPIEPFLEAEPGSILVVQRDDQLLPAMEASRERGEVQLLQQFDDRRGPRILIYQVR